VVPLRQGLTADRDGCGCADAVLGRCAVVFGRDGAEAASGLAVV
jgi:hypothetical protein